MNSTDSQNDGVAMQAMEKMRMTWSGPAVAIQGGHDAEDGAGDDGDDEAEEAELQRDGQRGGDASGHGLVRGTERAQIAMEEAGHVVAVANDQRIVEAVLDAVGLQLVG